MLNRTKVLAAGAAAVGAGVLLVGPLNAAAQDDDDPTETTTDASAPEETRDERAARWLEDALAPLVSSGTLTQSQADAVVDAIDEARPDRGGGRWGERGRWGGHGGPMAGHWGDGLEAAAEVLGLDEDDLRDALREGQTIAEVAVANDVDVQAVIDALVANAQARIDDAVADGRLDDDEATQRRADVVERITDIVEHGFPARGDGIGPGHRRDDEDAPAPPTSAGDETTATTDGGS